MRSRACRRRLEILSGAIRHYDARRILAGMGKELDARTAVIVSATRELLRQRRARLEHFLGQLEALSPTAILERGYALVFDSSGKLAAGCEPGQQRGTDLSPPGARHRDRHRQAKRVGALGWGAGDGYGVTPLPIPNSRPAPGHPPAVELVSSSRLQ